MGGQEENHSTILTGAKGLGDNDNINNIKRTLLGG